MVQDSRLLGRLQEEKVEEGLLLGFVVECVPVGLLIVRVLDHEFVRGGLREKGILYDTKKYRVSHN